jgi:hypothetical protein
MGRPLAELRLMSQATNQKSFNTGEWAPQLSARVDMERYHSGAALIRNFFVDYRGGASSRIGTKFCAPVFNSASIIRMIQFQVSFDLGYALEFGNGYIRFFHEGAPVLEAAATITNVNQANPGLVTANNDYIVGDMIYISTVAGMIQLNNRFYYVRTVSAADFTLNDMFNTQVDTTGYLPYLGAGFAQRLYKISSPYLDSDLALLKFVQNNNTMIICHPAYPPHILTLNTATSWTLAPIVFGSSVGVPSGVSVATTLGAGSVNYSYLVTAIDARGQESGPSTTATLAAVLDLRTTAGTNTVSWSPVSGAVAYNVYKSEVSVTNPVPTGSQHGYIGQVTGTDLADSNIAPNFDISPPTQQSPFANGSPVSYVTVSVVGQYNAQPVITFDTSPNGRTAVGQAISRLLSTSLASGGAGYLVGQNVFFQAGIAVQVTGVALGGVVTTYIVTNVGNAVTTVPTNPVMSSVNPPGATGLSLNIEWRLDSILLVDNGSGYTSVPAITFSGAGITINPVATAVLDTANAGNPAVPSFYQQRLVMGVLPQEPQTLHFSQPANFYNFDVHFPLQPNDAIDITLISGQVNNIKSMVPQTAGLIVLSDGLSWLINGGTPGSAVTPVQIASNPQSFIGANDVPPIVANFDILYVQAKGTGVRDSVYDFARNVFTSVDISVWSSHLFFGYTIEEWAWAEEPFKIVWAVRNDGELLSLTFQKEQEFIAWAHSDTLGEFKSVCTVVESAELSAGYRNAEYVVVERVVNSLTLKYIERFQERIFPNGAVDAWCVDSGVQYEGPATGVVRGGEHLRGLTCTGLYDGLVIPPFTMPADGVVNLPGNASKVTIGLGYTCQLKTLPLDVGEPTIQGKPKKVSEVVLKVFQTLGLKVGSSFDDLVVIKDLVRGNVSRMLTGQRDQVVTDLVTGEASGILDPTYTTPGQYCFQQDDPLPATILGVVPNVDVAK